MQEDYMLGRPDFSTWQTEECFSDLMCDQKNYEYCCDLIVDAQMKIDLNYYEQIGFAVAYLESFIKSEYFATSLKMHELDMVACEEIVRYIFGDDEDEIEILDEDFDDDL